MREHPTGPIPPALAPFALTASPFRRHRWPLLFSLVLHLGGVVVILANEARGGGRPGGGALPVDVFFLPRVERRAQRPGGLPLSQHPAGRLAHQRE